MRDCVVLGVGIHRFGRFEDIGLADLAYTAIQGALQDAGIPRNQIQVAYFANRDSLGAAPGVDVVTRAGFGGIPIVTVRNASCSGATAFWSAYSSVASGQYEVALALGAEKMARGLRPPPAGPEAPNTAMGLQVIPAWFAMNMRRRMHDYGETVEQYARVAVKNHKNGSLNPYAQYQKVFTLEEILNSRMIADPVKLLDLCPTGDGAAAAIICSKKIAKKYKAGSSISVAACVLYTDVYRSLMTPPLPSLSRQACQIAYETAEIGPEDIDIIELHDPATVQEVMHYEDLGLCPIGEGSTLVDKGTTELGGKIPVNTSGGLISRGHPIGATGLAQIAEIVWHLRGEAGQRQVKNAKVGLAHLEGAAGERRNEIGLATVIILKR